MGGAELAELAGRARGGDVAARNRIVEANRGLTRLVARRLIGAARRSVFDVDDLAQAAAIGLLRAAERWDPAVAPRFSTYAYPWAAGAARQTMARGGREEAAGDAIDAVPDPGPPATASVELRDEVAAALAVLRGRDRELVRLKYGLADGRERTCQEIGDRLGITRQAVNLAVLKAERRLRERVA